MPTDAALLRLLDLLKSRSYQFVTTTPATHTQIILRRTAETNLRDILGWSRAFNADADPDVVALLGEAGMLERLQGGLLRSRVRVSTLDDLLFLHSAYPTDQNDSVFFGPDSYRFASFLKAEAPRLQPRGRTRRPAARATVRTPTAAGWATWRKPHDTQRTSCMPAGLPCRRHARWRRAPRCGALL